MQDYPTAEAEVQTDEVPAPAPEVIVMEAAPVAAPKSPRKANKYWMGNFLEFFSTKPM